MMFSGGDMRLAWVVVVGAGVAGGCGMMAHPATGEGAGGTGGAVMPGAGGGGSFDGGDGGSDEDGVLPPAGARILPAVAVALPDICGARTPDGWCWVSPRPQGIPLSDASSPRDGELWAVGANGTVLHAAAGGFWNLVDAGLTAGLTAVSATADGAVWVGSYDGDVARGDATGGVWDRLPRPGLVRVTGLWAAGRDEAWAVGAETTAYHWTAAAGWTAYDLGMDGVAAVTGRAADDVWAATMIGHYARWDGARWTSGDIEIQSRGEYPWETKEDLYFSRMGVLDDGTIWSSAVSTHDNAAAYVLPAGGGAWIRSAAYALAGAGIADHWASGASGAVIRVSPFGPDATDEIQVGERPLLVGRADDVWAVAGSSVRHFSSGGWDQAASLFAQTYYVAATSPVDVWASGQGPTTWRAQIAHWDGARWTTFALGDDVINPPALAAGAGGAAWFASSSLWRWDGRQVDEIPYPPELLPMPSWSASNVVATPGGNVWVLGSTLGGHEALLRFDGRRWHPAALPASLVMTGPGIGFRGSSDRDLWILVGAGTTFHFDGDRWSDPIVLPPGGTDIRDLVVLGPDDVWVGPLHFDGARWTNTLPPPINSMGVVFSSWASGADDVWMATDHGLRHWDGTAWSGLLSLPGSGVWASVAGTGRGDVWLAGWDGLIHGTTSRPASPRSP
jgi:hypothetical protein